MLMTPLIAVAASALGGADTASWPLSIQTSGEDVAWTSPTSVRPDGGEYDLQVSITGVSVDVTYFGIEFGPIDVSDQLPDSSFGGIFEGPCPLDGGTTSFLEPPPPEPVTIAFDISLGLDENGQGNMLMENIVLGTASTDIPIFGEVTVQLETVYVDLVVDVIVIGTPCSTDINGDDQTDVNDILQLLAAYGQEDPDSDVDGDGFVGVNDVLAMIAGWGPCS
ncbi:MAG: hypothetical protein CMJ29_12325 [Phycisphaerae bacterium]|nr:hypothetical protein [Phycisphaerae bacterium]MAT82415.1 hypothetical protein [Phycisphaerae bacterium]|tara:strand:+ start:267 stop:932 length:666 start_codon:yes stop_codon:yes gene_type:complete